MLAHLQGGQVEAERLGLPGQVLELPVGQPGRPGRDQRRLDQAHIGQELPRVPVAVTPTCGAAEQGGAGGSQALGGQQELLEVGLVRPAGGDGGGLAREGGGVALDGGEQLSLWRGGGGGDGQGVADPPGDPLQPPQHVVGLDGHGRPGGLGGDAGVAVTVAADPAPPAEVGRERRRPGAGGLPGHRLLQRPVGGRHQPEQGGVEHGHDRADLVQRARPAAAELGGAPQAGDLLQQPAGGRRLVVAGQPGGVQAGQLTAIRRRASTTARRLASVGWAVSTGATSSRPSSLARPSSPAASLTSATAASYDSRTCPPCWRRSRRVRTRCCSSARLTSWK